MSGNEGMGYGRFRYHTNHLHCENIPLADLAQRFGTPLYVYSRAAILENAQAYRAHAPHAALV